MRFRTDLSIVSLDNWFKQKEKQVYMIKEKRAYEYRYLVVDKLSSFTPREVEIFNNTGFIVGDIGYGEDY